MKTTYFDSGVNIELGDDASKILYNASKQTWDNRKGGLGEIIVPFDDFSGVRAINVSGLPKGTLMSIGFDGVGTKVELAERANNHRTVAFDLFAMVCDDAVARGAEPVLIGSILDVGSLDIGKVMQLAEGYVNAAKAANVAVINGEIAELGFRVGGYGSFNYNWGAAVVWFARKERLLTGRKIKPGDLLVGLKEKGFRSNGLSLLRKVMRDAHGNGWHKEMYKGKSIAKLSLEPSRIYTKAVVEMTGGFEGEPKAKIHGIAHITGGGIPGKLARVLKPSGFGATISNPYTPCELMIYCQKKGKIEDAEAYKTWNMGQGMIIITPKPEEVMKIADSHSLESKVIGWVDERKGIRILSKGAYARQKYITF